MKVSAHLCRRLPWLNLPLAVLLALLQRTPAARIFAGAGDYVLTSPAGQMLRAALTVATLGALHSRAGATQFVGPSGPVVGTVGTPLQVGFTYNGTPSAPARFAFDGTLPPGLAFIPAPNGNIINSGTPVIAGTPTQAGNFSISVQGFNAEGLTNSVQQSITFEITGGSATAPAITTQPASQTVAAGATVVFSVQASGSPAPTFQWRRDGANLAGATGATLTLNNVQAANAGVYSVVVTNSAGSVTSANANLTVSATSTAPTITTQPSSATVTAGQPVTFTVVATGSPAPTFQWQRNGANLAGATSASFALASAQVADGGSYTVVVTNPAGSVTSQVATLTVTSSSGAPPVFTTQPTPVTVATGSTVVFSVTATRATAYQWRKDGVNIAGATGPILIVSGAGAGQAGSYSAVASNGAGSAVSSGATLAVTSAPATSVGRLINLSILTTAGAGDRALTLGATVGGAGTSGALPLVIRAIGPTLTQFGIGAESVLPDPVMELNPANDPTPIATNDNWGGGGALAAAFNGVGAFALPPGSLDSAILHSAAVPTGLSSIGRTVKVVGKGSASGIVIAEVYDAAGDARTTTTPRLTNLSTLMAIDAGGDLTVGFVLRGTTARTLLVRGIGPTLGSTFGIPGVMPDPKLELFDADTGSKVAENNDWAGDTSILSASASVGAFPLAGATTKDAVLLVTLPDGKYSAKVSGADGGGGTVIVEVYEVP